MAIYLVQHGLSLPKEDDPSRGLSPEGISDVERIAGVAKGYGVRVEGIVHSGKKRALQTAEIFRAALSPTNGLRQEQGLAPMDEVTALAKRLDSQGNIMYVGHLPFMERLTSLLVADNQELRVFKFQNGGIVCLDQQQGNWSITWTLMPNIG